MDTERDHRTFERTVLKYAVGLCLGLLLLVVHPVWVDITARGDFATGRLAMHRATVLSTTYDSGWDTSSHWLTQKISLRLDNGAELTTAMSRTVLDVDEGATVSVGFSGGRLVSVEGTYIRSSSALAVFGLLIMSGALVLSGVYAVLIRRSGSARRDPYTSGYVTQALVLYLLFVLLSDVLSDDRYEGWRPVMGLVVATAVPLTVFWFRFRRPAPAPIVQPDKT